MNSDCLTENMFFMIIIIYSRARYIKTALETKKILRRQRQCFVVVI